MNIVSFEIDFREKKVLSMPMFRWCCLKKCFKCFFFCDEILLVGAAVPLFDSYKWMKNLLVKVLDFILYRKQWEKFFRCTIFHELKSVAKAKMAPNNLQVSEGGITVKPGQDSICELIIWKVNLFVYSVTCTWYQIAFKWSVNLLLELFSIWWDGKHFNG